MAVVNDVIEKIAVKGERESGLPPGGQWELSEEGKKLAAQLRDELVEQEKRLKSSTKQCPVDGKVSKYFGLTGSFQIAIPVYLCPDGHKFSWRPDTGSKVFGQPGTPK